jgi:putative FmdB family regulatory protein
LVHCPGGERRGLQGKEEAMPVYEFECPEGTVTEKTVPMGTREIECPKCGEKAKRIMSRCTFTLKGGGWYADGYGSTRKKS